MTLRCVTITGADDSVDPKSLAMLSAAYPFVEWGILRSRKRMGEARYPSAVWLRRLSETAKAAPMRLSLHLCGELARETLSGAAGALLNNSGVSPARVQVNGFLFGGDDFLELLRQFRQFEWILQAGDVRTLEKARDVARVVRSTTAVAALWDPSGGRGLRHAGGAPKPPVDLKAMGVAGGVGLDNVLDVCRQVGGEAYNSWIDLETGARDGNDCFDLAKVGQLLWLAARFFDLETEDATA